MGVTGHGGTELEQTGDYYQYQRVWISLSGCGRSKNEISLVNQWMAVCKVWRGLGHVNMM